MKGNEMVAFKILASLYPDSKPSEIRKIISKALAKDINNDDVELWIILAKETEEEPKKEVVKERVIEHHYHDYWYPYRNYVTTTTLTCDNSTAWSDSITASSNTIDSSYVTVTAGDICDCSTVATSYTL